MGCGEAIANRQAAAHSNPAHWSTKRKVVTDGHHTWTPEEVAQFESRHPLGSMAHLAMSIMLYTGARRSDAPRLGKCKQVGIRHGCLLTEEKRTS
ncbi:hypothetical protein M0Q28_06305 [Patescibacteria group bacterium]|jgi:hypothetical protein|nr:hypothetical protein [Patescibacteria group bacterium]